MTNCLAPARARAFRQQGGFCFYCSQPMWLSDDDAFSKRFCIRRRQARTYQCTAEHLVEKQRGGKGGTNIVAACRYCNSLRHRGRQDRARSPQVWRTRVQTLVAKGKWRTLGEGAS